MTGWCLRGALESLRNFAASLHCAVQMLQSVAERPRGTAELLVEMIWRLLATPPFCASAPVVAVKRWSGGAWR